MGSSPSSGRSSPARRCRDSGCACASASAALPPPESSAAPGLRVSPLQLADHADQPAVSFPLLRLHLAFDLRAAGEPPGQVGLEPGPPYQEPPVPLVEVPLVELD